MSFFGLQHYLAFLVSLMGVALIWSNHFLMGDSLFVSLVRDPPPSRNVSLPTETTHDLSLKFNRATKTAYDGFVSEFDRHKRYIHDFLHFYGSGGSHSAPPGENDYAILQRTFQFIRDEFDDETILLQCEDRRQRYNAEVALAYYRKLHKEFALIDLSRYKTGQIGLMWRTDAQLISGKGQFICGALDCSQEDDLVTLELDFKYQEDRKSVV